MSGYTTGSVLKITGLTKLYKNGRGVQNLNLSVGEGQVYGLLGPNGSGKTTTLKLIVGLIFRNSGSIEFMGKEVSENFEAVMPQIGCMLESVAHYDGLSAYENMLLTARYFPEIPRSRIDELLTLTGVYDVRKEKVGRFSLGMRQRLSIAQAMYNYPKLMILDEPLNGLDIQGMLEVREIIVSLSHEGASFLISSHLAGELEKTCTHAGIIQSGSLICEDTVSNILENYASIEDYYVSKTEETRHAAV